MSDTTRRDFIKTTSAAAAALPFASIATSAWAGGSDKLNVGVIGCGGRGTGAVHNCISAGEGVYLVAMADTFPAKCHAAKGNLADLGERVTVKDSNIFGGLEGYKEVANHPDVDIVINTTAPGFRPQHLAEVVKAGKHAFVEKPVCVDPAGYRACIAAGEQAAHQRTAIVTGTMYRRQNSYVEAVKRIHDGMIGDLVSAESYYCSTGIWYRPRREGVSDAEYQIDNWYHFVWVCGDQIVEQAVHNIDVVNWVMGSTPVSLYGSGGQMTRPDDSEIYDHISLDMMYPNGANVSFKCRQIPGSNAKVLNTFRGTKGIAYVNPGGSRIVSHDGEELFRHDGAGNNPYVKEHEALIESIRAERPIMEIQDVSDSSLTAVAGRYAAYSGQDVKYDWVRDESTLDLFPKDLTMETSIESPGVAVPGQWKLV